MNRRMRPALRGLCAFALALAMRNSAAAEPERFGVDTRIDDCVPIEAGRFRHLLAVELEASDQGEAARERALTVTLHCREGGIELRLDSELGRTSALRRIELRGVEPRALERLLALTAAELVLASAGEAERPGVAPRAAAAQPPHAPPPVESVQLGAAGEVLLFSSALQPIPCASVRLTLPLPASLALRVGTQLGHANLTSSVRLARGGGALGVSATLASLLVAVLYVAHAAQIDFELGAGARVGFVAMAGMQPPDPELAAEQFYAPWSGPLVSAGIGYRLGRALRVGLGIELGLVAVRARALAPDRSVVTQLRDAWSCASLGLEWSP